MLLCEGFLYPEPRTPKPRGQNTINDIFTKLRTLFNWAFDLELTRNRPFRHFKVKECVYGQPIFIAIIILLHFQTGA